MSKHCTLFRIEDKRSNTKYINVKSAKAITSVQIEQLLLLGNIGLKLARWRFEAYVQINQGMSFY